LVALSTLQVGSKQQLKPQGEQRGDAMSPDLMLFFPLLDGKTHLKLVYCH
jgi:hypothetical protein